LGKAFTPFKRLLDHDYGLKGGLRTDKRGSELPSARLLSTTLGRSTESFSKKPNDGIRTIFLMQMGQFIDHDLAHSPNFPDTNCCTDDGRSINNGPSLTKEERENCIPIEIPRNDPFYSKTVNGKRRCLKMARAMIAPNLNCEMGSREQVISKI
jgi:peroxidase